MCLFVFLTCILTIEFNKISLFLFRSFSNSLISLLCHIGYLFLHQYIANTIRALDLPDLIFTAVKKSVYILEGITYRVQKIELILSRLGYHFPVVMIAIHILALLFDMSQLLYFLPILLLCTPMKQFYLIPGFFL